MVNEKFSEVMTFEVRPEVCKRDTHEQNYEEKILGRKKTGTIVINQKRTWLEKKERAVFNEV